MSANLRVFWGPVLLCFFFSHCFSGSFFLYIFCIFVSFCSYFLTLLSVGVLWGLGGSLFFQKRLAFGSAIYLVGSLYAKFSAWSFSNPWVFWLLYKALWELACGSKFSREIPSHLVYLFSKVKPIFWWAGFISSLFLC